MKISLDIQINSVPLGTKEDKENPKNDKSQYLVFDDLELLPDRWGFLEEKRAIRIHIKKWHIEEYPVSYCDQCLAEGKRVRAVSSEVTSETRRGWCGSHYRQFLLDANPIPPEGSSVPQGSSKCPLCGRFVNIPMGDANACPCGEASIDFMGHWHKVPEGVPYFATIWDERNRIGGEKNSEGQK